MLQRVLVATISDPNLAGSIFSGLVVNRLTPAAQRYERGL